MIISSIYNNLELKNNIDYLDGAILMVPFFAINYENNLDIESAIEVLKKKNKLIILGIDKISREKEFVDIKSFIEKYKDDNEILFYSSDLGIINLCMDLNIISRLIYDPKTMITNTEDAKCYLDFNLNSLGISNEITLDIPKEFKLKSR